MIFEIWKTTYTRAEAESYAARDHHEAALVWGQEYDRKTGSDSIAKGATSPEIFVAHGEVVRRFRICGRQTPV